MRVPGVDWIALWHVYHPFFFWGYSISNCSIGLWTARRTLPGSWILAWLFGCVASSSVLIFPFVILLCIPVWTVVFLLGGSTVTDSFVMVPIAASVAAWDTLLDAAMVRLLSRNAVSRRQVWVLFRANFLIAGIAITLVIAHALICPIELIASTPTISDKHVGAGALTRPAAPGAANRRAEFARPGEGTRAYVSREAAKGESPFGISM